MCGIVCTMQDITSSLYDFRQLCLCHHTHYIWHRVDCICVITSTVLMRSHQLYFWDHICYNSQNHIHSIQHYRHCMISQPLHSWHQIPYIWYHLQGLWHLVPYTCNITDTMFVNTCQLCLTSHGAKTVQTLYLKSKPPYVYLCDHTHCIDDIIHTVFMTWHLLYLCTLCTVYDISHTIYDITTLCLLHQSIISHIKLIISHNTSTVSLSSHPDYDHKTSILCMITQAQYVWYHMNIYDITSTL